MIDFLISPVFADGGAANQPQFGLMELAFPIILLVLFYFLLIRPQSKKAKEHRAMQDALTKGDEIITDGGLMGKIIDISDSAVTVQLAENIDVKVRRDSINAVLPKGTLKKL